MCNVSCAHVQAAAFTGAHHSRSGYWKGAMNPPLAPSMWILISQPCSSLSFPACEP